LKNFKSYELNHKSRRCLNYHTACGIYCESNRVGYSKRKKNVYRWIRDLATEISIRVGKSKITNVEWRVSAKQWLLKNGLIKMVKAGKVLAHFTSELCPI